MGRGRKRAFSMLDQSRDDADLLYPITPSFGWPVPTETSGDNTLGSLAYISGANTQRRYSGGGDAVISQPGRRRKRERESRGLLPLYYTL